MKNRLTSCNGPATPTRPYGCRCLASHHPPQFPQGLPSFGPQKRPCLVFWKWLAALVVPHDGRGHSVPEQCCKHFIAPRQSLFQELSIGTVIFPQEVVPCGITTGRSTASKMCRRLKYGIASSLSFGQITGMFGLSRSKSNRVAS